MIIVDTSVIVAWLDKTHPHHRASLKAISYYAERDTLAVSSVTYGELAAGGRTREAVDEDLRDFEEIPSILTLPGVRAWHFASTGARIQMIRSCPISSFAPRQPS